MSASLYLLIGLGLGGLLGGLIGWLWSARRHPWPDNRLEDELRQQLSQRDAELGQLRSQLIEAGNVRAAATARQEAAEKLLAEQRELYEQRLKEASRAQEKALADLREAFKALSAEALKQTQPEFLRLANETFGKFQAVAKGDLMERQQAIATLIAPLQKTLEEYQGRLRQSERSQSEALGEVKKHLEMLGQQSQTLSSETLQLRRILSSNQARGRWGEETLRRVIEAAGMSAHCDFSEQTQAGDLKPDLIVHLPGDRVIIVDAKVPDLDFLDAIESADVQQRSEALVNHARKLKDTIKSLADRNYPGQFSNALDHVVLFLPAESLFSAALEGDRELIVWSQNRRILLATPATLIGLLRAVCLSWQYHAQTENARAIAKAAGELYLRVAKFTDHFDKIRAGLERANSAFNEAVGSYERMVRPSGERLLKLGAAAENNELPDVKTLDGPLRLISDG